MLHRLTTITAATLFVLCLGMGSAWACTVPNVFVNNTIADADQMDANFTAVLACVNVNLVVGPNSSTSGNIASWNNTGGSLLKDSGVGFPIPVASGGTGDTGTGWTVFTPSVACQSGSLGTNSPGGKFKTIGKTVFFTATLGITTNSTCAGNMTFTLPVTAAGGVYQIGGVNQTTGVAGVCVITPSNFFMFCNKYDGTYLGGDGNVLAYTGVYVSQ